jgi:hypothetical protein
MMNLILVYRSPNGHVEDGGNGKCDLAKALEASFEKLFLVFKFK